MTLPQTVPDRLTELAAQELESVKTWARELDPTFRVAFLIELCRVLDLQHVMQYLSKNTQHRMPIPDFDLMLRGWNPALGLLLSAPSTFRGIPLQESTSKSRDAAMTFLHQLGRSVLLEESAQMIRFGMADGRRIGDRIVLKMSERIARDYFLDRLEPEKLKHLEKKAGWSDPLQSQIDKSLLKDVTARMERLVFPWRTSHGTMIGYSAEPELDNHFIAAVANETIDWRNEAGIHPDAAIENVSGGTVTAIGLLLVSSYLKHIGFVDVGKRRIPEANYAMSLTIWKPTSELTTSICEFTGMPNEEVSAALKLFTFSTDQHQFFQTDTTPFVPMLIEVSDGYLLSPVSSIFRNPFQGVRTLQEQRSNRIQASIRKPREPWMVSDLCHLFLGNRYDIVDRPILLKRGGNVVTDIDAAVLDRTTGELALFQLKWQEFGTYAIKERRSRAKNFVDQVDSWAEKVRSWIHEFGSHRLFQSLGLKICTASQIPAIRLFAIGRSASRFQSYGYEPKSKELSVCAWPQFVRLRYEVGPAEHVIDSLHHRIQEEKSYAIPMKPMPHEIVAAGQRIEFEDLWNSFDDED
jgi:hypothetical protein